MVSDRSGLSDLTDAELPVLLPVRRLITIVYVKEIKNCQQICTLGIKSGI